MQSPRYVSWQDIRANIKKVNKKLYDIAAGATDFLKKPAPTSKLRHVIKQHLSQPEKIKVSNI